MSAREPLSSKKCGCLYEGKRALRKCLEHGAKLPLEGSGVVLM